MFDGPWNMFYEHRSCSMDHRTCSGVIIAGGAGGAAPRNCRGPGGRHAPIIVGGLGAAHSQYCKGVWGAASPPIPKLKSCVLGGSEAPTKEKQPLVLA